MRCNSSRHTNNPKIVYKSRKEGSFMLWNTFESDKKSLEEEFNDFHWDRGNGLSPEELKAKCESIVRENEGASRMTVKSKLLACIFEDAQVAVNPNDWFAEKINHANIIGEYRDLWQAEVDQLLGSLTATAAQQADCGFYEDYYNFSHTAPDWQKILELGIPGLLKRVQESRSDNETESQRDFYDAVERVYSSVLVFLERLSKEADSFKGSHPKMKVVSQVLSNLASGAPSTLLEAMELVTIFYAIQNDIELTGIRSLGSLDILFYRFYKEDLESGRYTEEQLREIIDYFLYRSELRKVVSGLPFNLGGRDKDGNDLINELSYVIVEEYRKLGIHDPKIMIKTHAAIPADFLELVFSCIKEGKSSFCFINDDVMPKALEKVGISKEDAMDYVVVGCYEPVASGKEVACTSAAWLSIVKPLEVAIHNGCDPVSHQQVGPSAQAEELADFEGFYSYWKRSMKYFTDALITVISEREKHFIDISPSPFFSGAFSPCVENGKDGFAGGAKYNNTSISVAGLATAVDSMLAIKKLVFEKKLLTLEELAAVLKDDWRGHEDLRSLALNSVPKFGNQDPEADELMKDMAQYVTSLINNQPNGRGGVWRCGLFSVMSFTRLGERTGATPDGRLAGRPLSKNLCAAVGQDKSGPTALINSVCKIDFTDVPDGAVLDLVLHETAVSGKEGLMAMIGLMKSFMAEGGPAIHMNVFDPEVLKRAQAEPEKYATLQVRLCGWNEYFVTLSKTVQDEFILQSENSVGARVS